jgi:RHS repeat-associated protein
MQTSAGGNEEERCYSYPFGDCSSCTGADATEHHFTSKERDTESGLDYFGTRYLSSNPGRFMRPDWASAPTAVPYATFGDPQSLNLYAYVGNNPNSGIDVDGHVGDYGSNFCDASCQYPGAGETGATPPALQPQSEIGTGPPSSNGGPCINCDGQSGAPAPSNPDPPNPDPQAQ